MGSREEDQIEVKSEHRHEFFTEAVAEDPILAGWEIHGFNTYSKLSYPELVSFMSERMLSHEEIYAVLKNGQLYMAHQSFYQTTEKWLLNRGEFEVSTWKSCSKNFEKIQVKDQCCLHKYSDATNKKFSYSLVSGSEVDRSVYLVLSQRPRRKRVEPLEEVDEPFCKLLNEGIACLNKAKKTKNLNEARALRDKALKVLNSDES